jgi:hypothetical protein
MFGLRILRNFAVLAILTGAVLASTPRPAAAQGWCYFSRFTCSSHTTGCHFCGGSTRCCYISCYDTLYHRYCSEIL